MMGTPLQASSISAAIEQALIETQVAAPGHIVEYDASKRLAKVQHGIQRKWRGVGYQPINPIPNVPVCFPGGAGIEITWNLESGDTCLLVFCDRGIDNWLEHGGIEEPIATRIHHLTDAVCLPGLRPFSDPGEAADDGFLIRQPASGAEIKVSSDGDIEATNEGGAYLTMDSGGGMDLGSTAGSIIDQIDNLVTATDTAVVPTTLGPQQPQNPMFATIKTTLAAIKGSA